MAKNDAATTLLLPAGFTAAEVFAAVAKNRTHATVGVVPLKNKKYRVPTAVLRCFLYASIRASDICVLFDPNNESIAYAVQMYNIRPGFFRFEN